MSFNNNDSMEPPTKKQQIELNYCEAYITKSNKLVLKNNYEYNKGKNNDDDIIINSDNNPMKLFVLQFQTVDAADIYLFLDIGDETKTLKEIFAKFMNGNLTIGIEEHYGNSNRWITYGGTINDEPNSEIKLHYTTTKSYPDNHAWRSTTWDLFEEFVPK
jgi:hypothetical protein